MLNRRERARSFRSRVVLSSFCARQYVHMLIQWIIILLFSRINNVEAITSSFVVAFRCRTHRIDCQAAVDVTVATTTVCFVTVAAAAVARNHDVVNILFSYLHIPEA